MKVGSKMRRRTKNLLLITNGRANFISIFLGGRLLEARFLGQFA